MHHLWVLRLPPRNNDLAFPLTGGDPLDLHLDTPHTHTPQLPVTNDWAPGADFSVAPNLDASGYPGEDVLRDLLKDNAKEHPKMTGATLYFLDEAARFNRNPSQASIPQTASVGQAQAAAGQVPTSAHPPFDVLSVRRDFPILKELVNGRPLAWLDNAATTQKPQSVIDRLSYFYEHENSNIHRAAHEIAARATDAYEGARDKIADFLNASSSKEIVFVRGTTEAINLVAKSWGKKHIGKDDEILISHLEHHANIVPWQMLCAETGAKLRKLLL
jgi:cysteine desulfurase/selenocysteine lyase